MPEARDGKRTALADVSGGGFFIRRVGSPGALAVRCARKPLARRYISPANNKENIPPVWALRSATPKRRTPLPDWYPRTPLRDITAIVKAIERSRLRIAAVRQQSERPEDSLQSSNLTTALIAGQDITRCSKAQDSVDVASGSSSTNLVASPAPTLTKDDLKVYSSPSETPIVTPSRPIDPALTDQREKKLSSSIEQIEKIVKRNQKRSSKAAQPSKRAMQRRTLMSMR